MQVEIKDLHGELGKTIIYVTHDQEEALTMSDRIVVLKDGRIAQVGTPMEIYERPCSAYVAGFIGEANLIDGRVERQVGDRIQIATQAGTIEARSEAPARNGAAVQVMLRPEALQIRGRNDAGATGSGLQGRVTQVSFVGDALVYRIAVAEQNFVAKSVRSRRSEVLHTGDFAEISFHADDVLVFGADSTPTRSYR
jgi:putative spermidine/putrescine transport system ATP-binding protein